MIMRWHLRRTTLWILWCGSILGGIALARAGCRFPGWGLAALGALWVWTVWRKSGWMVLSVCLLGIGTGCWRGGAYMQQVQLYQTLYGHKITLTVRALDDGVYGKYSQLTFDAGNVMLANGQRLAGRLQAGGYGTNAVFQGDEVEMTGKLLPARGSVQGRIGFAKLTVLGHHPSFAAEVRRKFAAGMQSAVPEPLASFAMGLLIGQRATLPDGTKQDLLMVGLTHIIAVSGYNLTIILRAGKGLFARHSKRLALLFSYALIGAFLLVAGTSASITRAAIVSLLSIWTGYYGRPMRPMLLILLAAALTAWANPFYEWSDAGWYLSFLAFGGVLVLAPMLHDRLHRRLQSSIVATMTLECLCAEALSLPYVLYTFGQMSFIGLPANLLVAALVPLAMLVSFAAGLAGMLAGSISGWLAWPARIILTYMLDTAHFFAGLPHVFVQNVRFPLAMLLGSYAAVGLIAFSLHHKTKALKSATITDKINMNHKEQGLERSFEVVNN